MARRRALSIPLEDVDLPVYLRRRVADIVEE